METTQIGTAHEWNRVAAEIALTPRAVAPRSAITVNRMKTPIGRRGKGAASRVKGTAAGAEKTQVTIQTTRRQATMALVTTRSEGKTRAKIRVETRARNVVATVATPQVTALTPPRPLTLTPGRRTTVNLMVPDIGLLEAVDARLTAVGN